jgi:ATP-binding cassette subfamily F protein 3
LQDLPDGILVSQLSGGQKTRLGLAKILIDEPDVLILDEPTNHLDIGMLEWLEHWINSFDGGVLIVSHDRTFLDNTVTSILDLDPITKSVYRYQGNYTQYLEQYLNKQEKQLAAYRDQVYEIRKMKQDISKTKNQAYRVEITTTSREPTIRRYAKKVARKAKSREKKFDRYLESDERIEKPGQSWQMKVEFEDGKHHSQNVAIFDKLCVGYSANRELIPSFSHSIRYGGRIALTGPNGSGKTTLLRTISSEIEPLSGSVTIGANIQIGYLTQEQESLPSNLNVVEIIQIDANMSETDVRSFLHYFLFSGDDVFLQVKELSFGERSRLQLASLIVQGCDFLLLDEPINHLDIPSRTQFEQALSQFDGTVLAVVHDRYFIQRFANELWVLDDSGTIHINHVGGT